MLLPSTPPKQLFFKIKIDDIEFEIIDISETRKGNVNYNYFERRMTAITRKDTYVNCMANYIKIDNWFNRINLGDYKKNIILNDIQFLGVYVIDYTLCGTDNNIKVTFSYDYINGDLELFRKKQIRKEKLNKINSNENK